MEKGIVYAIVTMAWEVWTLRKKAFYDKACVWAIKGCRLSFFLARRAKKIHPQDIAHFGSKNTSMCVPYSSQNFSAKHYFIFSCINMSHPLTGSGARKVFQR